MFAMVFAPSASANRLVHVSRCAELSPSAKSRWVAPRTLDFAVESQNVSYKFGTKLRAIFTF